MARSVDPLSALGVHRSMVDRANFRRVVGASAAAVTAIQAVTAALALRDGRRDYADAVWGPGLAAVALTGAVLGNGDVARRWGLATVVTGWAVRLERQMTQRIGGSDEEDARYTEFLEGDGPGAVLLKVFVTQAVAQLLVSAPLQLAAASTLPRGRRRWLAPAGLILMVTGAVVEAEADRQKSRYSERDRDERPDVLDTGLWGWSRHPNYLGDSLVWDGAWLTAAASAPGALTLPAPIAMSYLLMFATGAKRTERRMQERPGYRDYQQRVSFFFPRPAKAVEAPVQPEG
jgi:steroid 5-alpha reductase family enzyme